VLVKPAEAKLPSSEIELDADTWVSRELSACARIDSRKTLGELNSTAGPRLTAVLSAQDIAPAQLKATIATLSLGGARSLIAFDAKALATRAELTSAQASPSARD
jgi:hypothetical protein